MIPATMMMSLAISLASPSDHPSPSAPCELSSASSISAALQCLQISDLSLSGLSDLQSIDLSSCTSDLDKCQSLIQNEISNHPHSAFAQIASQLSTSPDLACPCVTNAASSLNNCVPIFEHLASYCDMILSSASAVDSAFPSLSSCSDILDAVCPSHASFQETISCLEGHISELDGKCSIPLNSMLANLYGDCEQDLTRLCGSEYVISCLQDNFESLSKPCQTQFGSYLHGDYPCLEESKLLCADVTDPDEIFQCLSEFLDSKNKKKKLSEDCRSIVAGYKTCSSEAEQQPEDGPPEESDGSAGPKPPPKDRDDGDEDKDSKPAPANKLPPQSQSQRRLQKSKPAPKPKPGPGGEKPCWARGAGSDGDVDVDGSSGTDVGLQDGSNPLQQQHGSSSNGSSNSTISVTAIAVITVCVGIIMTLLAALLYTQQRGVYSEDDMPTVKGYWRAPSIQASLYDDSTHSEGAVVYGEGGGLEMETTSSKITSSSFRPDCPSEVRI